MKADRFKRKTHFSLLEVIVAMVIFAVFAVTTAGVTTRIAKMWRQRKSEFDVIHSARWAVERMTSELRQSHVSALLRIVGGTAAIYCSGNITSVCDGIAAVSSDSASVIYFWRDGKNLYRGRGPTFSAAVNNRQKLADYLYYNAANNSDVKNGLFAADSLDRVYDIYLNVRDEDTIKNGSPVEYKIKGQVRPQK